MVQVSEGPNKQYSATITVDPTDVNEAPLAGLDLNVTPAEDVKDTYVLAQVQASDPDTRADRDDDTINNDFNNLTYEISGGNDQLDFGGQLVNSRAYVSRFNFSGSDQQRKVGVLSGGMRNRVHLAKMLKEGANVILLDEPTNDLDVNTMRALEEALENFAGCAVVISHDRWFLDRIATHILAFEGDSNATFFEGNWSEYEEDRKKRLGAAADQPHRIKYRRLEV